MLQYKLLLKSIPEFNVHTFYTDHANVEIQQRACEYLEVFKEQWDDERTGIFEPIPFKGDENMLVDARNR